MSRTTRQIDTGAAATTQKVELTPLTRDLSSGTGLESMAPWPQTMQARKVGKHAVKQWFHGEQLTSMVYQVDEGMLQFPPLPYDEHVCVLSGRAVLTTDGGKRYEFVAGDVFVAPKGWSGTWEFFEGYRELCTFETKTIDATMDEWFP
jgi:uncharacterized cupin superfamily protein